MNHYKLLTLMFGSLIIAACGGGGGGSDTTDRTSPQVVLLSPADGETDVARNAVLSATFSEDIFASTIDNSSFSLSNANGKVAGDVSFDAMTNVASFKPSANLAMLRSYTGNLISNNITDLSGNPLAALNWSFTTRDGAWGTTQLIDTDNINPASSPKVAVDAKGNAMAVWSQYAGGDESIRAIRYDAITGWGTAELIENNTGDARYPQIAIDANGNALVVWYQYDGAVFNIWANRYTESAGWGIAEKIENDNAGNALLPQIAIDASGNAMAVWYQYDGIRNNIWANDYTAGTGWGTAVIIDKEAGNADRPKVAINDSGEAHAVWQQFDGIRYSIWSNRYTAGTGWSIALPVETVNENAIFADIAIDASGNALTVWVQSDGMFEHIWGNRYTAGTGWGAAALVESGNDGESCCADLAMNSSGNALAVWYQDSGTSNGTWASHYNANTGWGTPIQIETSSVEPQVAIDASGNALAVWRDFDGTRHSTWAKRYTTVAGWETAVRIENDTGVGADYPQVAVDTEGNAVAVWSQNDGLSHKVWANRFE